MNHTTTNEERNLRLTSRKLPDLDSCLAWVVRKFDSEFAQADMVEIKIHQYYESDGEKLKTKWEANISGIVSDDE